ncbi:Uncharacterized protein BC88300_04637 [Bacillus cytotoxicus]|uniref:type II toxin-antitoxin system HicA family toxin n=1 Tax=Bacillus cytotoxicus TaxID=580165 RepID=UPI00086402BA|nr:type II toxin-antitoxin system HicA family toxin [Bacillus cytotoxicus]SCN42944.1 Uncharacterized protein BC88300_04637 [Bacillus cytotoxicus]
MVYLRTFRKITKRLKKEGWYLHKVEGSHHQFKHPSKPGKVTVEFHGGNKDIDIFVVRSIYKQAGWL